MKRLIILLVVVMSFYQAQAQDDKERERIKALKTAYITQELNLKNKVAQKFWPIYDEYELKRRALYHREHRDIADIDCITEKKAEELVKELVEIEKEDYELKKQYFDDLSAIFSARDIIKLHQLEEDFHRKLIREYRAKREKERDNNKNEE